MWVDNIIIIFGWTLCNYLHKISVILHFSLNKKMKITHECEDYRQETIYLTLILAAMTPPPLPPPPLSFSFFAFLLNEHADAYTYKLSSRVLFLTAFTLPLPVLVSSGCCEAMTVVLAVDCEVTLAQLHWDTAVQQRSKAETRATNREKEISNRQLSFLIASIVFHYFLLTNFSMQII